jgi:putative transposase
MSRPPRFDLPGIAQHVIQRGNDRQPCFFASDDYRRYLRYLTEIASREGCAIHAYVLMTNHAHLLVTPSVKGGVGRMMQALGRRYVHHVNQTYRRTGTLWEGRYKACLVAGDAHLLQCHRYIELNPLRAGIAADPRDYRWSSHRHNAFGEHDPLIRPHAIYRELAARTKQRLVRYRAFVMEEVAAKETEAIRSHVQRQRLYGSARFRRTIEARLDYPVAPRKIGRPCKSPSPSKRMGAKKSRL